MKKLFKLGLLSLLVLSLSSCMTIPLNQGFYSASEKESQDSVKVTIEKYIEIHDIDNSFKRTKTKLKTKFFTNQRQVILINPGVHTFSLKYNTGSVYSNVIGIIANFEKGHEYKIISKVKKGKVNFDVINLETNKSSVLTKAELAERAKTKVTNFVGAVLDPISEGSNKIVVEENDEFILTSYSDMRYELKNKKTGEIETGYRGFEINNFFNISGTVYLQSGDSFSSKEEFLKSDYKKTAKTVLSVTECDKNTVTYMYIKPIEKFGQELKFNISVK